VYWGASGFRYLLSFAAPGGDGDSNAKTSLAYIQLEKQNERLKEALIRCVIFSCQIHLEFFICIK